LKIYKGDKHPHDVQNPTIVNFKDLNKKNTIRI
jgi:ribosomal protein L13